MAYRFRRGFVNLTPSWLHTGDGEKILYSLGTIIDASCERMRQALVNRFPEYVETAEALVRIGRDRLITRGVTETDDSYAARLVEFRYPKGHRVRGNAFALLRQVRALFASLGDVKVRTVDVRGNWYTIDYDGTESYDWNLGDWNWDGVAASPRWGRFWLIIYTDQIYPDMVTDVLNIGDPLLWGSGVIGTPGYNIGINDPDLYGSGLPGDPGGSGLYSLPSYQPAINAILRQWKPAGTMPQGTIYATDPDSFVPGVTGETDGTWDVASNRIDSAGFGEYG